MRGTEVSQNTQQAVDAAGCWDSCRVSTKHPCVVQRPLWSRKSPWIPGFQLCSSHSFITYQLWPWAGELTLSKASCPHLLNERESFPCLPHSTAIAAALRRHRKLSRRVIVFGIWFYPPVLARGQIFCKKHGWPGDRQHTMLLPCSLPSTTCKTTGTGMSGPECYDLCKDGARVSSCPVSILSSCIIIYYHLINTETNGS